MSTISYLKKIVNNGGHDDTSEEKIAIAIVAVHAEEYKNAMLALNGKNEKMSHFEAEKNLKACSDFFLSDTFAVLVNRQIDGESFKEMLNNEVEEICNRKPKNKKK